MYFYLQYFFALGKPFILRSVKQFMQKSDPLGHLTFWDTSEIFHFGTPLRSFHFETPPRFSNLGHPQDLTFWDTTERIILHFIFHLQSKQLRERHKVIHELIILFNRHIPHSVAIVFRFRTHHRQSQFQDSEHIIYILYSSVIVSRFRTYYIHSLLFRHSFKIQNISYTYFTLPLQFQDS